MIKAAGLFNRTAQQRRQGQQLIDIPPLAGLGIEMQQRGRLHVEKLQHSLLVPRHHPVVHTFQQAVHLIKVAVRFRQQAVGKQRVTHFAGDGQRQRQIRRGPLFAQAA